ncbi:MAG: NAD-dependent epimerase/dehydratase family protein [Myxococcota bacterium]|jgi:nucleoside-diphosphate-sugar epimerase|nr:NAD-dependent epimerase/dehydratase family protein [Myxococcota bacterium]
MLEGKHIFITGGAGFIGTRLSALLAPRNRITILDTLHRDALSGTPLAEHPNVSFVKADVRDAHAVRQAMSGATHVVHLASIAGVDTVMNNPWLTMDVCLKGMVNVLEAARDCQGIERVVDFSTSEVFGRYAYRVREGDATSLGAVGEARWTYAVSKLATEHLCHVSYKQFGLPTVAVRPFNIFGPGQVGSGAIHHFVVRALRGERITVHNDGSQIRAWCYIDDMIDALLLVLEKPQAVGHTFNIGNPRTAVTVYNLARLVKALAGSRCEVACVDWPHPDVELRVPDISSARALLGFEPKIDLEDGLLKTIDWYRARDQRAI